MTDPTRWRALLIGIDHYRHVPDLEGAAADVAQARAFLMAAGVPEGRIRILRDEQATRSGMLDAMREHLLDAEDLASGDQVVIHFSGHGARMRDPLDRSPSGYIESLVAHDSGPGGGWNIPDRTIGALLDRLARKTPHITVILDCCHSGSGTRQPPPRSRLAQPDDRPPPADLDAEWLAGLDGADGFTGSGAMAHTVLAACRDRELALEHTEVTDDRVGHHGLFSWCLYPALETAAPGSSYRGVMERVTARVTALAPHQHPQLEGRVDRVLFGGADVRRDPFMTVVRADSSGFVIDAGALHGLAGGDRLALHPASVRTRAELGVPLALATVGAVQPTTSRARLDLQLPAPGQPRTLPSPEALLHARVVRAAPPTTGGRVRFEVAPGAAPLDAPPSDLPWRPVGSDEPADIVIEVGPEAVVVRDRAGCPRLEPRPRGPWIWGALSSIARFDRLDRLTNPDPGSALQGAFDLRLRRHDPAAVDPGQSARVEPIDGRWILPYDPDAPEALFTVEVANRSPLRAFAQLLLLSADFSVIKLYPSERSAQEVEPGRSLFVGHDLARERIAPWLPDTPWWTRSDNALLLIASQKPTAVELLTQSGLDGALRSPAAERPRGLAGLLLDCAAGHRMLRRRAPEQWGITRLPITVMRRPRRTPFGPGALTLPIGLDLDGGARSGHITAAAHDRFTAFEPLPRAPLEALRRDGLMPIPSPAPGAGEAPLVLRFEARPGPGAPLRVKVAHPAELVPVAFDAAGYTVVGEPAGPGVAIIDPGIGGALDRPLLLAYRR